MMSSSPLHYCRVAECTYPSTHTTIAHRCGRCNVYGHGQLECRNPSLVADLRRFGADELPYNLYCTIAGCATRITHTNSSHHCRTCNERGPHSMVNCPSRTRERSRFYDRMNDLAADHENTASSPASSAAAVLVRAALVARTRAAAVPVTAPVSGRTGPRGDPPRADSRAPANVPAPEPEAQSSSATFDSVFPPPPTSGHIINKECPICRVKSDVDTSNTLFTGGACCVCLDESKKMVIFKECSHAQVCSDCVHRLK